MEIEFQATSLIQCQNCKLNIQQINGTQQKTHLFGKLKTPFVTKPPWTFQRKVQILFCYKTLIKKILLYACLFENRFLYKTFTKVLWGDLVTVFAKQFLPASKKEVSMWEFRAKDKYFMIIFLLFSPLTVLFSKNKRIV